MSLSLTHPCSTIYLWSMALLHEAVGSKLMDTRMIERNIARGVMTAQAYQASVEKLPDDAENAEWVSINSFMDEDDDTLPLMNGHVH